MFFKKNKPKKSNFQNPDIPELENKISIDTPSDNIKPEIKISNVSDHLHITGSITASGNICASGRFTSPHIRTKKLYISGLSRVFIDWNYIWNSSYLLN